MKIKSVSINHEIFQHTMACLLAYAAHIEDKEVDDSFPGLDSIGIAMLTIFSALENLGKFKQEDIAIELEGLASYFRSKEGPSDE